ncbi:MAG: YkgJ family cysteine cluster protein [Bacteroidia bacterium]|nr:YkgJ family cysteine cluster protein [Bacteroidia bacterium]
MTENSSDLQHFLVLAGGRKSATIKFIELIKKKPPSNLDDLFHDLHNRVFENINCLDCANCCKSISPVLKHHDINRISCFLKMKTSLFSHQFTRVDEDGDWVFLTQPCPFLLAGNYCRIYEVRPKACREYPHTNSIKMYRLLDITSRNYFVCPAVFEIIEELKKLI